MHTVRMFREILQKQTLPTSWYLYVMVTQNMVRTLKDKRTFRRKKKLDL